MIDHIVLTGTVEAHCLAIVINRQVEHAPLLLHSTTGCISYSAVGILLYQTVDAIVSLGEMLVFLVEKRQPQLCLEVARHQNKKVLIVETRKVVTFQFLVDKSPVEKSRNVGLIEEEHLVELILGIVPLLQLYVPCSLFQAQVYTVRMIRKNICGMCQGVAQGCTSLLSQRLASAAKQQGKHSSKHKRTVSSHYAFFIQLTIHSPTSVVP